MQKELDSLMQRAKVDYERKRKELDDEYQKNIEAIERVFSLMGAGDNSQTVVPADTNLQDGHEGGTKTTMKKADADTVREIIDKFTEEYTIHNVRGVAAELDPPCEVSRNVFYHVLKQKKRVGKIETIQEGSGRTPAVYKNINNNGNIRMVRIDKNNIKE